MVILFVDLMKVENPLIMAISQKLMAKFGHGLSFYLES